MKKADMNSSVLEKRNRLVDIRTKMYELQLLEPTSENQLKLADLKEELQAIRKDFKKAINKQNKEEGRVL